jgi:hypothetical protein
VNVDRVQSSALRRTWQQLPEATREAVEAVAGPILRVESVDAGFSSHLAIVIDTEGEHAVERTFVKGIPVDDPEVWTQRREAALGPHVQPLGPALRWQITAGGWDLLGFDYIAGHFADYRIDADLAATTVAMASLPRLHCPPEIELNDAVRRWGRYADPAEQELFSGTALLHTDWNYSNVIIGEAGEAHLVDWPWATRGAAWIDPACWIVWLVFAGREPAEAEQWTALIPAWHTATGRQLDAFSAALAGEWADTAHRHPNVWTHSLRDAARRWAQHREGL